MQNSEHKIDELFRSKLAGFEVTPPPEVWDRIANDLAHSKKRGRMLLIWSLSGAASLLFAFLMGWYLAGQSSQSANDELTAKLEEYRAVQVPPPLSEPVIHQQLAVHFDEPQFKPVQHYSPENSVTKTAQANVESLPETIVRLNSRDTKLRIPGIPSQQLVGEKDEFFTAADKAIIEANLLAMSDGKIEQEKGNWAVGVNASPVYRFNQPTFGKAQELMAYDVVQSPLPSTYQTNLAGGLSFAYETAGRIAIISGVNYTEVAQNTGGVALSFIGHNWLNEGDQYNYQSDSQTEGISTIRNGSSNNVILNTQVGLANINLPQGTSIASAKTLNSMIPEATQNYDYKQQARYVEVPLLMRYRIIDHRFGLNVLGGINTNVLVSNTVRLEDQRNVVASGKIEGLRPLTWSSSLGMGVDYELTNHLNLNFEPTLKIQLNSLNNQSYFDAKPYTFGVFSGVSYRF